MMVLQSFVRKIFRDQARIYIRSIELFSRNKYLNKNENLKENRNK